MLFFFLRGNLDSTKAHHSFGRPVQPHLSGTLPMRRTNPSHLRLGDRCRSSPSICIDPRCGSRSHSRRPCLYSSKRGVILHFYSNFAIKTNTSCSIPKKASPTSLVQNQEGQNPMVHQKDFPPNKFSAQKSLLRTAVCPDGSASCVN